MNRVPVIEIAGTLIATVPADLRDKDAVAFEEELIGRLEATGHRGVLLDLSAMEIVDSFMGRLFVEIAHGARLMGAHTVVVGIQPAVAITLVELGLQLRGIRTALDAQKGLSLLRRLTKGPRGESNHRR